jgi:hypothetical protein
MAVTAAWPRRFMMSGITGAAFLSVATGCRPESSMPDVKDARAEPISLAAGQAVTVVLLDKVGGGIDAVVVRDR